ncbi:MAG: nitronate monooxygenase [Planctomycetota bacterium]|nr:MAG: nitronate monooxygenase [Planctomycetota bacterium]
MAERIQTRFTEQLGIEVPLICGAMYPCTNPELVAAVSDAGGIGVIQPMSFEFVHRVPLEEGLRRIRQLTDRPIGFNAIVETSVKAYFDRMRRWIDIALEHGVRFFVTALGKPDWVVEQAHAAGAVVYHDVTNRTHALRARDAGVDGLICVNRLAGGHAGKLDPQELHEQLADLGLPLVCAGGIGDEHDFVRALQMGYDAAQLGTRFIATDECQVSPAYKEAIVRARADDVVLTDKLSGVPCAVIRTPELDRAGYRAGPIARWLLRGRRTKHLMRAVYQIRSLWSLRRAATGAASYRNVWQAGKSVERIERVEPAAAVVERFARAAREALGAARAP